MLEARALFHQKLNRRQPKMLATDNCTKAAVSLTFRPSQRASLSPFPFDLLLMQRAYNNADPWSGQISFPGGRHEECDASMQATAERETEEEIGFQLQASDYLGRIDDVLGPIVSDEKTVHVSSFVYQLETNPSISPNHEVEQIIWMPLSNLLDPDRAVHFKHPSVTDLTMQGVRLDALSRDDEPLILWGLSFYLMRHLIETLELESN